MESIRVGFLKGIGLTLGSLQRRRTYAEHWDSDPIVLHTGALAATSL